jgi:hypothetical protein
MRGMGVIDALVENRLRKAFENGGLVVTGCERYARKEAA